MDPSVFLYDIDACGFVLLANAGVFDDVEQAAAAWREIVGEAASDAQPTPVDTVERLYCISCWETGEIAVRGDESQSAMDNWFRARRHDQDIYDALKERGLLLPDVDSLTEEQDTEPVAGAFTNWYAERHDGAEPDAEAADALAEEWVRGTMPGTEYAVSPHRAGFRYTLLAEGWEIDHPLTVAVMALLPEWVRWLAERVSLPENLVGRMVAVAAGDPLTERDCPGAELT